MQNTAFTSFSHNEQDFKLENWSLALATSEEPQRNLSPYIKAFDSSIMPWHIRYCIQISLVSRPGTEQNKYQMKNQDFKSNTEFK